MYLGVEIGGTKLQAGVCDRRGRVKRLVREPVDRRGGAEKILTQLERLVPPLLESYPVNGIGVGFGGPVDVKHGRVVKSHQVKGWSGFALRRWFERQFGLPVVLENDSNCAALAEAVCGAGRGRRVVFYMNIGTGIGGGLVIDGQVHQGRYGAAEIGHTRVWGGEALPTTLRRSSQNKLQWPTVEDLASGLAIERRKSSVARSARVLGVALANVIALLNPDVVVVGGGVSLAGARFFRPLRDTVRALVFEPFGGNYRIVPAALGETVVVVGAALLAAGMVESKSKSRSRIRSRG